MTYTLKEIRDNIGIDKNHPSFSTFDVLAETNGIKKWLSIPHELYFPWALKESKQLCNYIEKHNFKTWEDAIEDLNSLDYDWNKNMSRYVDKYYPKRLFDILPEYSPDKLGNQIEDDLDDEA